MSMIGVPAAIAAITSFALPAMTSVANHARP
jgi:hypothetical protein